MTEELATAIGAARRNGHCRAAFPNKRTAAHDRSATDLFLETRHSARRTQGRRHPANHDPKRTGTTSERQQPRAISLAFVYTFV